MQFFYTAEADRQYLKYKTDPEVQNTFRDLIYLINERPSAGWTLDELVREIEDPYAKRIQKAIAKLPLPSNAKIVVATIRRPKRALPPPWLAAVVHLAGVPDGQDGEHTILTMGAISRTKDSELR
jgi:hypothetical protein